MSLLVRVAIRGIHEVGAHIKIISHDTNFNWNEVFKFEYFITTIIVIIIIINYENILTEELPEAGKYVRLLGTLRNQITKHNTQLKVSISKQVIIFIIIIIINNIWEDIS
jgi:hypothetical protein